MLCLCLRWLFLGSWLEFDGRLCFTVLIGFCANFLENKCKRKNE
jgi:hypothetical protein